MIIIQLAMIRSSPQHPTTTKMNWFRPWLADPNDKNHTAKSSFHQPVDQLDNDNNNQLILYNYYYWLWFSIHNNHQHGQIETTTRRLQLNGSIANKDSNKKPCVKKFICHLCSNRFNNRSQLTSHLRTHTGNICWNCIYH